VLALAWLFGGARAASAQTSGPSGSTDYVFSMGVLVRADARSITVRFEDGQTATYTLGPSTTIRSQNGDALTLDSLKPGVVVMVISEERSPVAVSIVNGGESGFHDAGPGDIRGHERACPGCGG